MVTFATAHQDGMVRTALTTLMTATQIPAKMKPLALTWRMAITAHVGQDGMERTVYPILITVPLTLVKMEFAMIR